MPIDVEPTEFFINNFSFVSMISKYTQSKIIILE